jgi:Uma2 family endonuclease
MLPMPTFSHQRILYFVFRLLDDFVRANQLGKAVFAPMPVRFEGDYFEPDIVFLRTGHPMRSSGHPEGADLVMEIVSGSPQDRQRDLHDKRVEYARRGVAEYWIVDPKLSTITVLALEASGKYREHGVFGEGTVATSPLLPGFEVPVREVFAEGAVGV